MNATQTLLWMTLGAAILAVIVGGITGVVAAHYRKYIMRALSDKPHAGRIITVNASQDHDHDHELAHSR